MNSYFFSHATTIARAIRYPVVAYRLLRMALCTQDPTVLGRLRWWRGGLARLPLVEIAPGIEAQDISLLRAFDRDTKLSVTLTELAALVAIARYIGAKRILEVGTWDGNTSANLAANTAACVVTIDLPPAFNPNREKLALSDNRRLNLGPRAELGRQIYACGVEENVAQIHGDSASIDWSTLGGQFDLVFIDGCHDGPYVVSDTENALSVLSEQGVIVWHDYGMITSVSEEVDRFVAVHKYRDFAVVQGTRLCVSARALPLSPSGDTPPDGSLNCDRIASNAALLSSESGNTIA